MTAAIAFGALAGCSVTPQPVPAPSAAVAAPAPLPQPAEPPLPPPVDLSGKWKLSADGGGTCLMTFGDIAGAAEGSIAPGGGCPGNFFTSRKWTFEHGTLIIRDYKGEPLGQLSFSADHFEGQLTNGAALTLTR